MGIELEGSSVTLEIKSNWTKQQQGRLVEWRQLQRQVSGIGPQNVNVDLKSESSDYFRMYGI